MDGRDSNGKPIIKYGIVSMHDAKEPVFYLGHSCDEWVIGNEAAARAFIEQLEQVISQSRPNAPLSNDGGSDE